MSVPGNRPLGCLWYVLTVAGLGGVAMAAQILAFGAPRHFPSPAWIVAAGAASAAVLAVGVAGIARVRRERMAWVEGDHPRVREDVAARMGPVLAHWMYARDEWEAHAERDYRAQRREGWIFGVGVGLIAAAAMVARGAPSWMAAATSAALLVPGWLGWRRWAMRMHRRAAGTHRPTVTIASNAVLIDGKREFLGDEGCHTRVVRYVDGPAPLLEITIAYPGRPRGDHTMRLPVPRGREDEARELERIFKAGRWRSPPRQVGGDASTE